MKTILRSGLEYGELVRAGARLKSGKALQEGLGVEAGGLISSCSSLGQVEDEFGFISGILAGLAEVLGSSLARCLDAEIEVLSQTHCRRMLDAV